MTRKWLSYSRLAGAKLITFLEENPCGGCGLTLHSGTTNYPNPDSLVAKPSEAVAVCKDVFSSI